MSASENDETLLAGLPARAAGPSGGELIGDRYELLSLLGRGGMGSVYRVRDRELDEAVALKVLHRDLLASDGMLARFRQEVKLARRVTHKNVARTYDIGEHGGDRFLTMELVEGESLASLLERRGALAIGEALAIARQMCAGMAAAHEAGVIHRDLKPENVCIAGDGRVVLMDFGIARAHLPGDARKTSGQILGTPAYMAPEQVQASDRIEAYADIYAFGAVLYEMLTGALAWPGESPIVVAAARLWAPPPDPRALRAELPEPIAALIQRCMAREPSERFESARALEEALSQLDATASSPTPVPPSPAPLGRGTTVAVLPFRHIGALDDAYLAEGLTEDLIDTLSMTQGLRVRARTEARGDAAPDELGRRLGVDVVVDGSVRKMGETLRVSARLIGSHDGFQIWASRFERPLAAALSMNDEVAIAIATALSTEHRAPIRAPLPDPAALELYFRARRGFSVFWTVGTGAIDESIARLREALERVPDDPRILAGYVSLRARLLSMTSGDPGEIETLARRALALAPHLGEPWFALATLRLNVDDAPAEAMTALRRAIANAPSLGDAHDLAGRILLEAGAVDEAAALLDRALWLDPQLPWGRVDRMRLAALQGRLDEMEALAAAGPNEEQWRIQSGLALRRFHLWWRTPASRVVGSVVPPNADARMLELDALYDRLMQGLPLGGEDREFLERFVSGVPARSRGRRLFAQIAAELHAFAGDEPGAARYLSMAVEHGLRDLPWMDLCPLFEPLRARSDWPALREEVAARAEPVLAAWFRGPPATLS